MMLKKKLFFVLVLFLIVALIIPLGIGCTPQQRPAPDNDRQGQERQMENNDRERDRITRNNAQKEAADLAEKITDRVQGVNSATVIFAEEIVYVGIDLYASFSGDRAENVKKEVAQLVKEHDPDIERVYVTEDADTFTRMQEIARDIENGKPLTGFLDELQNMFKRVTPSMG